MNDNDRQIVDLRSDTVTKPSAEMRAAMAAAVVGDDVFSEDPTINELQIYTAALLGKEKGLYCSSGTQTNQLAIKTHTQPGDEVIGEEGCHILNYESGAPGLISGILIRTISGDHGLYKAEDVERLIRPAEYHYPHTALIEIENTHNRAGGVIFPLDEIKKIKEAADRYNLPMHLDGARLWNASVASGIPLNEYAQYFDSVSVCFSKGLGAPVGSMLLGTAEFITRAHRFRKMLGGGMRQAGIIAAGALYAVKNNIERLAEDHKKAAILAEALAQSEHFEIGLDWVKTNIVIWQVVSEKYSAADVVDKLAEKGILVFAIGGEKIRGVCHMDVPFSGIEKAVEVIESL